MFYIAAFADLCCRIPVGVMSASAELMWNCVLSQICFDFFVPQ